MESCDIKKILPNAIYFTLQVRVLKIPSKLSQTQWLDGDTVFSLFNNMVGQMVDYNEMFVYGMANKSVRWNVWNPGQIEPP